MATKRSATKNSKGATLSPTHKKWGEDVLSHGFMTVPSLLLQSQARLKITPTQMNILLQLVEHWWEADRKVFPSMKALGERVRLGPKQVQRHTRALHQQGLITRKARFREGSQTSNEYELSGLVKKLRAIAAEVSKAKKLVASAKKRPAL